MIYEVIGSYVYIKVTVIYQLYILNIFMKAYMCKYEFNTSFALKTKVHFKCSELEAGKVLVSFVFDVSVSESF